MNKIIILIAVLLGIIALLLLYYWYMGPSGPSATTDEENSNLIKASVTIAGPADQGVSGILYLDELASGGTHIWGKITGLKTTSHGLHIHEKGDVSKGCGSIGAHYNPLSKAHGPRVLNDVETPNRHIGDLGNIVPNKSGVALIDFTDKYVNLSGQYSVLGRTIGVSQNTDDLGMGGNSQSTIDGNSGPTIGCGIISLR